MQTGEVIVIHGATRHHVRYESTKEGKRVSVYIPQYDMYFSAPDHIHTIRQRAANMVMAFHAYWDKWCI